MEKEIKEMLDRSICIIGSSFSVEIRKTGTTDGYENYHNDYYLNDVKIGRSSFDKNQQLHIGVMENGVSKKNLYAKTPEGIAHKMEAKLAPTNT